MLVPRELFLPPLTAPLVSSSHFCDLLTPDAWTSRPQVYVERQPSFASVRTAVTLADCFSSSDAAVKGRGWSGSPLRFLLWWAVGLRLCGSQTRDSGSRTTCSLSLPPQTDEATTLRRPNGEVWAEAGSAGCGHSRPSRSPSAEGFWPHTEHLWCVWRCCLGLSPLPGGSSDLRPSGDRDWCLDSGPGPAFGLAAIH